MSRRYGSRRSVTPETTSIPRELEFELFDENALDIPIEELREFLSADLFEIPADPSFKHRLREKLWELIQSGSFGYGRVRRD